MISEVQENVILGSGLKDPTTIGSRSVTFKHSQEVLWGICSADIVNHATFIHVHTRISSSRSVEQLTFYGVLRSTSNITETESYNILSLVTILYQ